NHSRDTFRIASGVSDSGRGSLRYGQNGVAAQLQGADNRFQIALECCERNLTNVSIGQAKTPSIIADEAEPIGEAAPKLGSGGALPVVLKVGGPGRSTHQRHALTDTCHRKIDPVLGSTKRNVLTGRNTICDSPARRCRW